MGPPVRGTVNGCPGATLVTFGWVYRHFLGEESAFAALYRAPTGLLPFPTLAVAIGVTTACGCLGSRGWGLAMATAGAFYGAFDARCAAVRARPAPPLRVAARVVDPGPVGTSIATIGLPWNPR